MSAPASRHLLVRLPALGTTGIGSLPHAELESALELSLAVDIPYLPQLPNGALRAGSEYMLAAALEGLPGLSFDALGHCTVDLGEWTAQRASFESTLEAALKSGSLQAFEPSTGSCRAWPRFLSEVATRKLPCAKVQIAGPATTRWITRTSGGQPLSDIPDLDQQLFRLLLAKSLAMVKALRQVDCVPLIFLDEPGLSALDWHDPRHFVVLQELALLVTALQAEGGLVGLHCCAKADWSRILGLELDIISLDVRLSLDALLEVREPLLRFLEAGSTFALGIVPTERGASYQLPELADSVELAFRSTLSGASEPWLQQVLTRLILTPACGVSSRSIPEAEQIFEEVRQAQLLLHAALTHEQLPPARA